MCRARAIGGTSKDSVFISLCPLRKDPAISQRYAHSHAAKLRRPRLQRRALPARLPAIHPARDRRARRHRDHRRKQRQHRSHTRRRGELSRCACYRGAPQGSSTGKAGGFPGQHWPTDRQRRRRFASARGLGCTSARQFCERPRSRLALRPAGLLRPQPAREPAGARLLHHGLDNLRAEPLCAARRLHGAGRQLRPAARRARTHRRLQSRAHVLRRRHGPSAPSAGGRPGLVHL